MISPTAGAQASPDPKQFAQNYAGNLAKIVQDAIDERTVKDPLWSGGVGTTIKDRADNYM